MLLRRKASARLGAAYRAPRPVCRYVQGHVSAVLHGATAAGDPAGRCRPAAVPADAMTAPSRRETRALLARAAEAQADAEAIAEIAGSARGEVVEAYAIAREPQVWTAIGKMSIETVKDTVDGRARLDG